LEPDQEKTEYLLGGLAQEVRDRIEDRLGEDPDYFEEMAAFEDDLLHQWHRGRLPKDLHARVRDVYESMPARRARLVSAGELIEGVRASAAAAAPRRVTAASWWSTWTMPRFVLATAGLVTVAALSVQLVRERGVGAESIVAVTLTTVAERGPGGPTLDRVSLPSTASSLKLSFELDGTAGAGPFDAELESVETRASTPIESSDVTRAATVTVLTVTVTAPSLSSGDYVLRVWRRGNRAAADLVATRSFRVVRE
jgi:hypothetical protein